ncbi:MAG: hypothetical protein JWQ65_152 [Devosia sp.]|nr:hypothetical protein [Devosia sp.]
MQTQGSDFVVWAALAGNLAIPAINMETRIKREFPSIGQLFLGARSPRAIARNEAE